MNLFKNITVFLLVIVIVNICYGLHPVVNPHIRRGVTELKSEK